MAVYGRSPGDVDDQALIYAAAATSQQQRTAPSADVRRRRIGCGGRPPHGTGGCSRQPPQPIYDRVMALTMPKQMIMTLEPRPVLLVTDLAHIVIIRAIRQVENSPM